jgi:membrane protease YdiL (CAAX protease family)
LKPLVESLSFTKSIWTGVAVIFWIFLAVVILPFVQKSSSITPALFLHLSSILLIMFLIIRLGGQISKTLLLNKIKIVWCLVAIVIGLIYWLFDHWLMDGLFKSNSQESIKAWQLANANYHHLSVLISSVIMAPIFEELFFRGLIFNAFLKRFNVIFAAFVAASLFALIHWSWPEFISLFLVGLIYAGLAYKSNSVITPLIAHMIHNLMTYFYFIQ